MAPTLLGVSSDVGEDSEIVEKMSHNKRQSFISLRIIRKEYGRLLTSLHEADWPSIDSDTNALLLLSWSTLTNAINSVAFPDILNFATDEPLTPVAQVRANLLSAGTFISLDKLVDLSLSLFHHIKYSFLFSSLKNWGRFGEWKSHLRLCVDNYVTHAAEIEPRMTAGTFWHAEKHSQCSVVSHFQQMERRNSPEQVINIQGYSQALVDESVDDRKGYYLEYVCPYRSGFTPAFV